VLKNLPVVFTFAPMNLLHYQRQLPGQDNPAGHRHVRQYAYIDTRGTPSYQLAYVLHPATLWNEFGPINLAVHVPSGIACKASVPMNRTVANAAPYAYTAVLVDRQRQERRVVHRIDKAAWDAKAVRDAKAAVPSATQQQARPELRLPIERRP